MAVWILIGEMLLVLALTTALLHKYGDWRRQHLVVSAATLVAWYFSFSIVAILPIDVVQTNYKQCLINYESTLNQSLTRSRRSGLLADKDALINPLSTTQIPTTASANSSVLPISTPVPQPHSPCAEPFTNVDDDVIKAMWLVVYWSSFFLTWLILPFMQSYSMAGEFTVLGKMKRSLIENAIFYGSYLAIVLALAVYLLVKGELKFDKEYLKTLVTTASNTWGLFFMVLLMGYGMVEVPRYVWDLSRREHRLRRTYFQVAKLHSEKSDATETLEDVLDNIKDAHAEIPQSSLFYPKLQIVLSKSPSNFQDRLKYRPGGGISTPRGGAMGGRNENGGNGDYANERKLVGLHKKLLVARQNLWRLEAKWEALLKKAFKLEDIVKSKSSGTSEFRRYSKGTGARHPVCTPRMEFYWKIVIVPKLLQMFGIVLAILAVTLVWSEVTFFRKDPVLSIYALFIADWFAQAHQYFLIQLTCVLLLVFMCVTVYWTVFRVRFFNYYYLSPHHHTDEYTLLFSGMLLCRLTPSICLNFLGVTHMDNSISNDATQQPCSFTEVMGHLSIVYFISDGFNIYFPLVLIVLCLATLFNLGSHVLSFIGFQQFMGDGELTSELIDEGQQLIKREHRRIERENRGEQRRKEWDERLNRAGRDAEKYASGAAGAGGENDDIEANFNAGKQQSYAGRRGGGRNMHAEAMRAKYSRNGPSGAPSFIMSKTNQSNGNSNGTANKLDSASDNSATDLLDDDYVDFQDHKNREEANNIKNFGARNTGPTSIFDDI